MLRPSVGACLSASYLMLICEGFGCPVPIHVSLPRRHHFDTDPPPSQHATYTVVIVMLNLLIAIVSQVYDRCQAREVYTQKRGLYTIQDQHPFDVFYLNSTPHTLPSPSQVNYEEEFLRAKAELICQIEQGTCIICIYSNAHIGLLIPLHTQQPFHTNTKRTTGFFLNKEDPVWFPPRLYFISKLNARAGSAGRHHTSLGGVSLGASLAGGYAGAGSSFSAGCSSLTLAGGRSGGCVYVWWLDGGWYGGLCTYAACTV